MTIVKSYHDAISKHFMAHQKYLRERERDFLRNYFRSVKIDSSRILLLSLLKVTASQREKGAMKTQYHGVARRKNSYVTITEI